jgi:hypothetical protein
MSKPTGGPKRLPDLASSVRIARVRSSLPGLREIAPAIVPKGEASVIDIVDDRVLETDIHERGLRGRNVPHDTIC